MKIRFLTLAFFIIIITTASARAEQFPATSWEDSTRDVYINNELDRSAQVLSSDGLPRLALISPKLDRALVLDVNEHTVSTLAKNVFRFATDRTSASSDAGIAVQEVGKFTRVDGPVYFFVVDGKPILIRSHPGFTGEMTMDKLWETVPVWRAVMENYQPEAQAVAALKANDKAANVTLLYGTWCPDSKNYIPRLIKALKAAGNDNLQIKLIGIDNQFHEPKDAVQPRRITNVPTVIVERDGHEIGRIVETPAAGTIEADLAAILSGKPVVHNGRWDRGPKLASGVYAYRDASGKDRGSESWELFSTSEGGYLAHSRITMGNVTTEVFHRVDGQRKPTFVEVTRQRGDERTRTRINIENHTLTARMRGSVSGVISQTLEVPDSLALSSPAVAAEGLRWGQSGGEQKQASLYVSPMEFDKALGALAQASFESRGEESVRVPAGEFRARHVARNADGEACEWWLHAQLGIPVRGQANGMQVVLTSLDVAPASK
jgi:thiol-disulfide isomerase/thioredoxin